MKFIDEVQITVTSGKGGDGCVSFRHEKYIEFGGPDGGNGGKGGDVYIMASKDLNTLVNYRGRKIYKAENGMGGHGRQKDGRYGDDLILMVPIGTIVTNINSEDVIADLGSDGDKILIAQGGRGGLGNAFFKTSTNQAPRFAQDGDPGTELFLHLELKLIADLALIGLPNAGKSTLISSLSAAKPKIADYPFTTLEPNLGVVKVDDKSFVLADIPGLIEDASIGKGLGHKFLRHIERTKALVHLVDCSMCLEPFEAYENYIVIREELTKYSQNLSNKKEIVCLTKIDAMTDEEIKNYQNFFEEQLGKKVLPISAVSRMNLKPLRNLMLKAIS